MLEYKILEEIVLNQTSFIQITDEPAPADKRWHGNKYTLYTHGRERCAVWSTNHKYANKVIRKKLANETHMHRLMRCGFELASFRELILKNTDASKDNISRNLVALRKYLERHVSEHGPVRHYETAFSMVRERIVKKINSPNQSRKQEVLARYIGLLVTEIYDHKGLEWLQSELSFEVPVVKSDEDIFSELRKQLTDPSFIPSEEVNEEDVD